MPIGVPVVDDVAFAGEFATASTSVRQRTHQLGHRTAVLLLFADPAPEHLVFQPELVVRASTVGSN